MASRIIFCYLRACLKKAVLPFFILTKIDSQEVASSFSSNLLDWLPLTKVWLEG